jgi:crotonobetaine/carnitine-CoA ligase
MLDYLGDRSLTDLLEERVQAHGERVFLIFEDRHQVRSEFTYAGFHARVKSFAQGLATNGIGPGDFVVVHLTNSPEFLIAWLSLARLGAVLIPSNVSNTVAELEHILTLTGARLVITEPRLLDTVEEAIAAGMTKAQVVVARGRIDGRTAFDDLLAAEGEPPRPAVGGNDLAELIFTSGTTRKPKGVMLTHANCIRAGLHAVHCLWLDEGERCLTALPLFHVNAQAMSVLAAMTVAGTVVLLEEFRASKFWSQVRAHEATQTCLVAMQLRTVLAQPSQSDERDHRVRRLFFAINVTDTEKEAFEARFGVTLINGYGCSEAMTLLACSPVVGPRRWPSVGLPAAGRRLLLLDDDGNEVPIGEVGEVVAEGVPGRDFMLGYYRDDEATAATLREGRLHTGDNAYADESGYLYFFDRKKDMIKRAGENVSATEVEAALLEHPMVLEVAVVGVFDAIRDEAVAAAIVTVQAGALTVDEVTEHCRARLSRFKIPTLVTFVEELPKTSIGKVRKDVLRKQFADAELGSARG